MAPPCVAASFDGGLPCVEGLKSRSVRRRDRLRKVALRHSVRQTAELKQYLYVSAGSENSYWSGSDDQCCSGVGLNPEAEAFLPENYNVAVGWHSDDKQLNEVLRCLAPEKYCSSGEVEIVSMHRHPEKAMMSDTGASDRKRLRETCHAEGLVSPLTLPANIIVNATYVLTRRKLKETITVDSLPVVDTPVMTVVKSQSAVLADEAHLALTRPMRVYKVPFANKTLRGTDIRVIGEAHVLRDSPLFVEGVVDVLERRGQRSRIVGYARAEAGGALHRVRGWIENEAVT